MRMAPAMDRMDMDMDKPTVLQMLSSLSTPNQSVKTQKWNKPKINSYFCWIIMEKEIKYMDFSFDLIYFVWVNCVDSIFKWTDLSSLVALSRN